MMRRALRWAFTALACVAASSSAHASLPPVGKDAPDFALRSLSGQQLALDALRGRIVVLNFFATWCPPCRAETPDLVALDRKYRSRGVVFFGVDDKESPQLVRVFASVKGIGYPIVLDSNGEVEETYDIRSIPTTLVIDKSGIVRYRNVQQLDAPTLSHVLDAILSGRSPQTTPTESAFDAIALEATKRINAAVAAHNPSAAITAGTVALKRLNGMQNGAHQAQLDFSQSTKELDGLQLALANAYRLSARADAPTGKARTDAEKEALLRGQVATDREQFVAALRAYSEAVALAPLDTAAYDGEYLAAYELHQYGAAESVARAEAQVAPGNPESWYTLASALNDLKEFAGATAAERRGIAIARSMLLKHPSAKTAAYEIGRGYLKMARTEILAGKAGAAVALLRRSAAAAPDTIVQQQADEQRLALVPARPDLRVAGRAELTSPASTPGQLYISVKNTAPSRRGIELAAAHVPKRWVLSFCYAKVCDPFRSTITLDPGKSLRVELKVVPLGPTGGPWRMNLARAGADRVVVDVTAKYARASIVVTGS